MQRFKDALSRVPVVPVIKLYGKIAAPTSGYSRGVINYQSVKPLLAKAFKQRRLAALALRINSPGGWPAQCDLIRNEINRLSAEHGNIPVLAFIEDMAASGGYYLACSAGEIYANRHSLIGSIGALAVHADLQTALKERASLALTLHRAGKRKAIFNNLEAASPESLKFTNYMLQGIHAGFIDVVKSSRGDRLKGAPESELFEGDIWLADKAQQLGLIDGVGDLEDVIAKKFGRSARLVDIGPRAGRSLPRVPLGLPTFSRLQPLEASGPLRRPATSLLATAAAFGVDRRWPRDL
uniref:Peptidase_S49 domain-containing protein n=1 Tax=Macrostomum lignano TaxID=282301 RepID=A0A1I8HWY1_9PLAT